METATTISKAREKMIIETIENCKQQIRILKLSLEHDSDNQTYIERHTAMVFEKERLSGMKLILIALGYEVEEETKEP